jgi:hypothetical protein
VFGFGIAGTFVPWQVKVIITRIDTSPKWGAKGGI